MNQTVGNWAKLFNKLGGTIQKCRTGLYGSLPKGISPKTMMWLLMAGQLTVLNILPGIITGFGEEFGHRGFMYAQLKKYGLLPALLVGGLIWFAWHVPLQLILPKTTGFTATQTLLNYFVLAIGAICTFVYMVYVFEKSQSIWVVSLAHIVLNNASASFSYLVAIQNQFSANIGLTLTMLLVLLLGVGKYFVKKMAGQYNNLEIVEGV